MSTHKNLFKQKKLAIIIAALLPVSAIADVKYDELKAQVEALQQQLNQVQLVLKQYETQTNKSSKQVIELQNELAENAALKQEVSEIKQELSQAAEWRNPNTLIHMSGYADIGYSSDSESFNVGTFSPIFHYQYKDLVMLEAELELEIGSDGETELALEYLTVDLFLGDNITFVGGKFLSPIGQFRQNLHPSWINKLVSAPPGFGHDGAAPTSEMGFQLRGGFEIGETFANYAFYVSNGPELISEQEHDEFEVEGIIAEGLSKDVDNKKAFGGRIGFLPVSGLEIGFSAATGKATVTQLELEDEGEHGKAMFNNTYGYLKDEHGEEPELHDEQARDYDVLGFDYAYRHNNFQLRGEYVKTKIGEATTGTTAGEGASWTSWYSQGSYLIPQSKWEPVIRYTDFTAPSEAASQEQWALGINYQYTSSVIVKATYEFNDGISGFRTNENRWLLQLAYGF